MTEVGGYFGFEDLGHKEYYPGLLALNTARNALCYIIKAYKIKKIYIPYYLCNCIEDTLLKNNMPFEKYHLEKDFEPIITKKLGKNEWILLVNYYGQLSPQRVEALKNKYINVVLDNTHAFFQSPIKGIPTLYSCRKFFGVADGAYLATEKILNEEFETDVSKDRMKHIIGRYEVNASEYYSDYQKIEADIAIEPIKLMSKLTRNILGAIDYIKVIEKRNSNFNFLHEKLQGLNKLKLYIPNGPFAYPFYSENAVDIRRKLAEKKIYIPTLWPNVMEGEAASELEKRYTQNILPIPCDQRYDLYAMDILLKELITCIS